MNITGRLPEAGNLKLIITRPLPEKHARPSKEYIQKGLTLKINLFDRINANKKYFFKRKHATKNGDRHIGRSYFGIWIVFLVFLPGFF